MFPRTAYVIAITHCLLFVLAESADDFAELCLDQGILDSVAPLVENLNTEDLLRSPVEQLQLEGIAEGRP